MSYNIVNAEFYVVSFSARYRWSIPSFLFSTQYFSISSCHLYNCRIFSTSWEIIRAIIGSSTAAVIHLSTGGFTEVGAVSRTHKHCGPWRPGEESQSTVVPGRSSFAPQRTNPRISVTGVFCRQMVELLVIHLFPLNPDIIIS